MTKSQYKPGFSRLVCCHRIVFFLLLAQIFIFLVVNWSISSVGQMSVSPVVLKGLEEFITRPSQINNANATQSPSEEINNQSQPMTTDDDNKTNPFPYTIERIKNEVYIWDTSPVMPHWMKEYLAWHRNERAKVNRENWQSFKFCVMRCLDTDGKCGGTADRIKTIPIIMYYAAQAKRILLIHWSRPALLQEFLLPPQGGIDWTIPEWLVEDLVHGDFAGNIDALPRKVVRRTEEVVVRTKLQSYNGGSIYYDRMAPGPPFEVIYHDMWNAMFTPAPKIQNIVHGHLSNLGIAPGEYVAAHLRGLYAREDRDKDQLEQFTINAINCASNLRPGAPIYFASDSKIAVDYVVDSLAKKKKTKIVALQRDYEPLHLEKAENWQNRTADEYYDTFVDLYLIALASCVTYNVGGYGQWGLWISSNSSCYNQHGTPKRLVPCQWSDAPSTDIGRREFSNVTSPFLQPISHGAIETSSNSTSLIEEHIGDDTPPEQASRAAKVDIPGAINRWSQSSIIPLWMKEYFEWHHEIRSKLTRRNWHNVNYLVVQCAAGHDRCGGISDRLQPMPLIVLLAARSNRILLIHWSRPCALEEFLVPPQGGLNWSVPEWLLRHIKTNNHIAGRLAGLVPQTQGKNQIVRVKYQSNNHGAEYFDEQDDVGVSFHEVFHDVFQVLFEPSKAVGVLIDSTMNGLGLVPGEYAATHFRALYGREERDVEQTKEVAINGANCASELRPGGPVFFASDYKVATDSVREYATVNGLPIVTLEHEAEPLHLDKAVDWEGRKPSEYYAAFVDLFLLGRSRCIAYNSGGFGTFGLNLSFNSSCSTRYFAKKILRRCPKWVGELQAK